MAATLQYFSSSLSLSSSFKSLSLSASPKPLPKPYKFQIKSSMEAGIGVMGTKLGMMTYFDPDGTVVPVTVIGFREGNIVTQVKTTNTDGYNAVQVGYRRVRDRKLTKPEMGHLSKSGVVPLRHLQEFRLVDVDGFEAGERLEVGKLFSEGDLVDVAGTTIGKGFQAQRSGHLPYNQCVNWRGHFGLADGLDQGVDLVGGYYDAGDHVKFGLPMAFTITLLSWSVIEYEKDIKAVDEFEHALEAIKWGTDYFIKAHTHPCVLWVQVGDGTSDHYCWQRLEDMTTPSRSFKIDKDSPGSEVAAETAAALASASIVFKKYNPQYSSLLLHHATQLFEFGDKYRGKYDRSVENVKGYYPSTSGYGDELLWAALWLYKATKNETFLDYVNENAYSLGGAGWAISEFSWDIKYAGVQLLAAKLLKEEGTPNKHKDILEQYKAKVEYYLCSCLNMNTDGKNVRLTPGGLLYTRKWNNLQYVVSATLLLTVYSDHLKSSIEVLQCPKGKLQSKDLLSFATYQVNYILGQNPKNMSYLIGFGDRYPNRVHHRAASTVPYKENKGFIGCSQGYDNWFGRQRPNPNVLEGAIVGGPDMNDEFRDVRGNFMQTEACTYNTAPMVGVFAKLHSLEKDGAKK